MISRKDSSIARRYGEAWTHEDGGRWRPGTETAAIMLRAAGYTQTKPGVWTQHQHKQLPAELTVASVEPVWPHAAYIKVSKL